MDSRILASSGLKQLNRPVLRALIPTVLLFVAFALYEPSVASSGNLQNIALQTSYLALFTLGQCIVLLTAGLDLSIGLAVSYVSVVSALAMVNAGPDPLVAVVAFVLVGLGLGIVIGSVNGFFVAVVGINPFVVTLGTFNILLALASTVTSGFPVAGFPPELARWLANATVLGIPIPIVISASILFVVSLLLGRTVFGRSLYLIGSNRRMAEVAGINVRLHTFMAYVLCTGVAALGALLLTARAGSGEPNIGGSLALETIAAAVIGGARLRGGQGGVLSAVVGALFITVLSNGMNFARIDGYIQQLCLGAIIILSLVVDRFSMGASRTS
jgi:ribose transport system permease protein